MARSLGKRGLEWTYRRVRGLRQSLREAVCVGKRGNMFPSKPAGAGTPGRNCGDVFTAEPAENAETVLVVIHPNQLGAIGVNFFPASVIMAVSALTGWFVMSIWRSFTGTAVAQVVKRVQWRVRRL